MIIGSIFNQSEYLNKALDAAWTRNSVIVNNISNIDTPNFKASKVEFESLLSAAINGDGLAMKRTDPRHMKGAGVDEIVPVISKDVETDIRMDGNNVDMNTEQAELAKNTLKYYTLIQKINHGFSDLRTVIESR
ncbi:MAG: flagellar basal body rod protein FlgB [Oscillospiraceae bacterium]|nr:flagellar basal body rod protein FlgB [Oscillospiraceae bacterium]